MDRIDIGSVLKSFGGGGHPAAGSATVKSDRLSPEELKQKIIEKIKSIRSNGAIVADLMSFPVTFVSADTPMSTVREIMEEKKIRGILVGSETNLEGIIVLWDLKKLKLDKQWNSPVKAFMVRDVATTAPGLPPAQAAQFMVKHNIGHLPVEHDGRIIGIVTRTDILNYFYGMLPE